MIVVISFPCICLSSFSNLFNYLLLCQPPPAPRMRGKLDSLIFAPDTAKITRTEDVNMSSDQSPTLWKSNGELSMDMSIKEAEVAVEVENVERPVDLYKVFLLHLFS